MKNKKMFVVFLRKTLFDSRFRLSFSWLVETFSRQKSPTKVAEDFVNLKYTYSSQLVLLRK